jgi:KinB signaling pathway activation protein
MKYPPRKADQAYGRRNAQLNLKKWMKLFGTTILIGGLAALLTGLFMKVIDPKFEGGDWLGWVVSGFLFGAIAHTGFFSYLMLNYIARSIFKRPYLWVALQGFIAFFVIVEIAYWTYGSDYPAATFWGLPLSLLAASMVVAWRKSSETTSASWIPTLFFMMAATTLEAIPGFQTRSLPSLVMLIVPLFVCNSYQIMQLHRILGSKVPVSAAAKAGS